MDNTQPIPVRRRHHTATQRRKLVALYRKSGLTQTEFARQHDLKLCTLHQWIHRAKKPTTLPPAVFKEVQLPASFSTPGPAVEIAVGAEITLRLGSASSPEFIAQVVHHLRQPC